MNKISREALDPAWRHVDVLPVCRDGDTLQGTWPLKEMRRLASSLMGDPPAGALVNWSAHGQPHPVAGTEPELWMRLQARAEVHLQCQRCLQALAQIVEVDRRFLFVRDAGRAEALDEEMEDDVLVLPQRLDLPELIEDELILALPLVPRHEGSCPQPLPQQALDALAEESAPHPFAALQALRDRTGGGPGGSAT